MKVEIKGIDLNAEKMRFYPVMLGIIEVVKSTKRKQGYIKLHLPDYMLNDLIMMSLNMNEKAIYEQYLVSCRVKE